MSFPVLNSSLPVPNQQQQLHTSIDHHQQYLVSHVIAKAQVKAISAFQGSINNSGNILPTNDISGTDGQVRDVGIKQLFPPSLQQWSRINDRTCYVIVFIFFYIFCSLRNSLVLTCFQFNNLLMYLHICLTLILCTAIYWCTYKYCYSYLSSHKRDNNAFLTGWGECFSAGESYSWQF